MPERTIDELCELADLYLHIHSAQSDTVGYLCKNLPSLAADKLIAKIMDIGERFPIEPSVFRNALEIVMDERRKSRDKEHEFERMQSAVKRNAA